MTQKSFAAVAALTLALVACDGLMKSDEPVIQEKRPAVDHDAQIEADIIAGRVEVMQEQVGQGLKVLGVAGPALAELPTDRETYRRLADAVERHNLLNKSACDAGIATGGRCAQPYMPLWYAGRARPDTSPAGLKAMAEEMQNEAVPLWGDVCAKAIAKTGNQDFCAIE
jgi:hypothetical protein